MSFINFERTCSHIRFVCVLLGLAFEFGTAQGHGHDTRASNARALNSRDLFNWQNVKVGFPHAS